VFQLKQRFILARVSRATRALYGIHGDDVYRRAHPVGELVIDANESANEALRLAKDGARIDAKEKTQEAETFAYLLEELLAREPSRGG
jgi:hypothetical protein